MFNLNWGVIGAGGISKTVMTDFLMPGATRGTSDVSHKVVAVAARDLSRAEKFVKDVVGVEPGTECKGERFSLFSSSQTRLILSLSLAYGSYKELTEDAKVDCVYIGTTHPEHFAPAKLALEAGKVCHVLLLSSFFLLLTIPCLDDHSTFYAKRQANLVQNRCSISLTSFVISQPFTVTSAQTEELLTLAKAKGVFIME